MEYHHTRHTSEKAASIRQTHGQAVHALQAHEAETQRTQAELDAARKSWSPELKFMERRRLDKREAKLYYALDNLIRTKGARTMDVVYAESAAAAHLREEPDRLYNAALVEADNEGVSIVTADPNALEKVRWQDAHIPHGKDQLYPIEHLNITNLTPEELERNLQAYPEMQESFTDAEIDEAKAFVMQLPLTHMTRNYSLFTASGNQDIHSHKTMTANELIAAADDTDANKARGFSFEFDSALGLDEYVFMCLGTFYPHEQDEHDDVAALLIDSQLLLDDDCIVTPLDISNVAPNAFSNHAIEWEADIKTVENYRSSAVTGKGWLEIISRRVASFHRDHPGEAYPVEIMFDLGEIKYRNTVPAPAIRGVLRTDHEIAEFEDSLAGVAALPRHQTDEKHD